MREAAPDDELFLILGADQAAALPEWHEPERVLELATVAVVGGQLEPQRHRDPLARLRGADAVRYLDMPLIQVSSIVRPPARPKGRPSATSCPERRS